MTNRKYAMVVGLYGNRKDRAAVSIITDNNVEIGMVSFSIYNGIVDKLSKAGVVTSLDIEKCKQVVQNSIKK